MMHCLPRNLLNEPLPTASLKYASVISIYNLGFSLAYLLITNDRNYRLAPHNGSMLILNYGRNFFYLLSISRLSFPGLLSCV